MNDKTLLLKKKVYQKNKKENNVNSKPKKSYFMFTIHNTKDNQHFLLVKWYTQTWSDLGIEIFGFLTFLKTAILVIHAFFVAKNYVKMLMF